MTALFGDEPIIITGTTNTGRRWAQFWQNDRCRVSMDNADAGTRAFQINHDCPDEWEQHAWDTYQRFVAGVMPEPTHTVEWAFGKPRFTAVPSSTGGTE